MTDINLVFDPATGTFDWDTTQYDLASGNDLETAVAVSIFSEAPTLGGPPFPVGWWGNSYATGTETVLGSQIETYLTTPINNPQALLRSMEKDAANALQWMIDDGVAASVTPVATFLTNSAVQLAIAIVQPTGTQQTFSWAWSTLP